MLRLAYLVSQYPAVSHTFILREVCELRRRGVHVHTISVNPPDRRAEHLGAEERREADRTFVLKLVPVHSVFFAFLRTVFLRPLGVVLGMLLAIRLGRGSPTATLRRFFYFAEAILVGDWMRRQCLVHLHVHFATPAATVALLAKRIFGISYSLTVHGPDEFYNVAEYHVREKIEAASFICAIGNYCRSQLMKLSDPCHWDKFVISPLGVDSDIFRKAPALGAKPSAFRILCVGRLVPSKGQALLLEAVKMIRAMGLSVEVTLAGDGPDRRRLESAASDMGISDCCRFLGAVNPDRIRELYEAADLFVLPSFAEGIPVVLMEAMAMELPCVSTTVNGIPELIESGRSGLLVPPSDAHSLCQAILTLMDDGDYRRSLASAGRGRVLEHYNLGSNIARLETIFRSRIVRAA